MFRRSILAAPALLLGSRSGRAQAVTESAAARPVVVASFSILAEMVARVGGEAVALTSLVGPDQQIAPFRPHRVDRSALKPAALLVENGLGLEPWLPGLRHASGFSGDSVVASALVQPRLLRPGVPDPRAWQDPRNGVLYIHSIAQALAAAAPAAAAGIHERAETYAGRVAQLDSALAQLFSEIPEARRHLVSIGDSMGYFGARYGVAIRALSVGEATPSARQIEQFAHEAQQDGARAILVDPLCDPRIGEQVSRRSGIALSGPIYTDALSVPGGPAATYLDLLRTNAQTIARAIQE